MLIQLNSNHFRRDVRKMLARRNCPCMTVPRVPQQEKNNISKRLILVRALPLHYIPQDAPSRSSSFVSPEHFSLSATNVICPIFSSLQADSFLLCLDKFSCLSFITSCEPWSRIKIHSFVEFSQRSLRDLDPIHLQQTNTKTQKYDNPTYAPSNPRCVPQSLFLPFSALAPSHSLTLSMQVFIVPITDVIRWIITNKAMRWWKSTSSMCTSAPPLVNPHLLQQCPRLHKRK